MNNTDIVYACSSSFDYSKLISPDAGPNFGLEYYWRVDKLTPELLDAPLPIVVDNRITDQDIDVLRVNLQSRKHPIFLRLVDANYEHREQAYYRFCLDHAAHPSVHFVLTYTPAELTHEIVMRASPKEYVFAPYLYSARNEVDIDPDSRKNIVLISGRISSEAYPVRSEFWQRTRRHPLWRLATRTLVHPGYPDVSGARAHSIVGPEYIKYMARHRFALVCGGRQKQEYLKYREIAYAGCVPFGEKPAALSGLSEAEFVEYRGRLLKSFRETIMNEGWQSIAKSFRGYMSRERDQRRMAAQVNAKIRKLNSV